MATGGGKVQREALAERKGQGDRSGNPRNATEAATLGREVQAADADQFAANTLPIIDAIPASGVADLRGLALALNSRGDPLLNAPNLPHGR